VRHSLGHLEAAALLPAPDERHECGARPLVALRSITDEDRTAADHADDKARVAGFQRFHEGVVRVPSDVHCAATSNPRGVPLTHMDTHCTAQCPQGEPEVHVDSTDAVHSPRGPKTRGDQVIQRTNGDHGNPAQRTGCTVTNGQSV